MKKFLTALMLSALIFTPVYAEEYAEEPATDNTAVSVPSSVQDEVPKGSEKHTPVDIYIYGNLVALPAAPEFADGTVTVPLKPYLENLISASDFQFEEFEGETTVTYGDRKIIFTAGSDTAYLNGKETALSAPIKEQDGFIYAPLRLVCEYFGYKVNARWFGDILAVYTNYPPPAEPPAADYVNSAGLSSNTPYLIWVNKSKYTVHVFLGSRGNWSEVYSCKCSIGTDATPTITGTYKFFSLEPKWTYEKFYVGPIMRFYGGYAIHTTLLNYDGTDYNATVGKKLSHGCVRVRPDDMNWLVSYVPLKTTVHITEK